MIDPVAQSAAQNSLVNQAGNNGMPQTVLQAIKNAAARTGVSFSYLLNKASQESGFDANAKASTSSATGLYQFTNQTWLGMVKNNGAQYGLGSYADHISVDSDGVAHVSDPSWKKAILGLRSDPQISAEMAGELDKRNMDSLQQNVSGKIGGTELYLAHFLGAGGASSFLNEMRANPNASAASVLPEAAAANPSVFYNASGEPRSLGQIYRHFAQKFDGTASGSTLVASAVSPAQTPSAVSMPAMIMAANASATGAGTGTTSSSGAPSYSPIFGGSATAMMSSAATGTSSLFATMVLAQSNIDNNASAADYVGALDQAHNKKNPTDALAASMA